jgi:hypothetical protein
VPPEIKEVPATQTRVTCPADYELATEVLPFSGGLYFQSSLNQPLREFAGKHYRPAYRYQSEYKEEVCIPLQDKSSSTD